MQQVRFILERQNNVLYVVCVLYITQFLFLDIDGVRVLHCPVGYLWRSCSSLALIRDKCGSFCTTLVLLRDICGDLVFYTRHAVIYLWSSCQSLFCYVVMYYFHVSNVLFCPVGFCYQYLYFVFHQYCFLTVDFSFSAVPVNIILHRCYLLGMCILYCSF